MAGVDNHRNRSDRSGPEPIIIAPLDPVEVSDNIQKYYVAICFIVGLHVTLLLWFSGFTQTLEDMPDNVSIIFLFIFIIIGFFWLRFQDCIWRALDQAPDCPINYNPKDRGFIPDDTTKGKLTNASLFVFEEINNLIESRQLPIKPLRGQLAWLGILLILVEFILGPIWIQLGLNWLLYTAGMVLFLVVGYRILSAVVHILATNDSVDSKVATETAYQATDLFEYVDEQFHYEPDPIIINEEEVRRKLSAEANPWAEPAAKTDDQTAPNETCAGADPGGGSPTEGQAGSTQKSDDESPLFDTRPRMRLVSPEEQVGFISKLFLGLLGGTLLFVILLLTFAGFRNGFSSAHDLVKFFMLWAGVDALVCWGVMQNRIRKMLKKAGELYPDYEFETETDHDRDYDEILALIAWFFLAVWKLVVELNIVVKLRSIKVKQVDKQLPWLMLAMYGLEYFFNERLQEAGLGNLFLAGGIVVFIIIAFEIQNAARAILRNDPKLYIMVTAPPPDDKNDGESGNDDRMTGFYHD